MTRTEFYHALDDFFVTHPSLDGLDLTSIFYDNGWCAYGEGKDATWLFFEDGNQISCALCR